MLGWLRTGGKARCCGARIPIFYLLAEISLGFGWAISGGLLSTNPRAALVVAGATGWSILLAGRRVLGGGS